MKIHNTLTRQTEEFSPLNNDSVRFYSCGPTVYDHVHIGNLSAYIMVDTLRRVLAASGYKVQTVMNFTDVDDKTIRRSQELYPELAPEEALQKLTRNYEQVFLDDTQKVGIDTNALTFVRATESIEGMRALITDLYEDGFAYVTDDGVYFSIDKYRASGKIYGQLSKLNAQNTSAARIDNDEYDKESVHDFALWKVRKAGEPSWPFELDGRDLAGRPGWHIECSVMSVNNLGQPFDIHTGGVDHIFPHHENEIAQSTAGKGDLYAKYFVHNEHLLVDGKKMSKSLNNFYTIRDIQEKGYDPLAFRLMVLQSHYRNQSNFTWENLGAAQNRLRKYQAFADLRWQVRKEIPDINIEYATNQMMEHIQSDLNIPPALAQINRDIDKADVIFEVNKKGFVRYLELIDSVLGLELLHSDDITEAQKAFIAQRQEAREAKDWAKSDELRNELHEQGIVVRDTDYGPVWSRL
jgi:cysteinyl-tRNA synthetase